MTAPFLSVGSSVKMRLPSRPWCSTALSAALPVFRARISSASVTESPGWARITESSVGPPSATVAVDSAVTTGDTDRLGGLRRGGSGGERWRRRGERCRRGVGVVAPR